MYDAGWDAQVKIIREYLDSHLTNLQMVGRNGMHKYNNQDHSMITAICAVHNILGANHDLWAINTEPDYHEEHRKEPARGFVARPAYGEPARVIETA